MVDFVLYVLGAIFLFSPFFAVYLVWSRHKMWERCRVAHYCWQAMSDFVAETRRLEDGSLDEEWWDVVQEHRILLKKFGMDVVPDDGVREFEMELYNRGYSVPMKHREAYPSMPSRSAAEGI